eukprot:3144929-Amphidinium_carterae.1
MPPATSLIQLVCIASVIARMLTNMLYSMYMKVSPMSHPKTKKKLEVESSAVFVFTCALDAIESGTLRNM